MNHRLVPGKSANVGAHADEVSKKFIASGATAKVGGYRPLRAEMDGTAEPVKKAPEGLTMPNYGALKLSDKSWESKTFGGIFRNSFKPLVILYTKCPGDCNASETS